MTLNPCSLKSIEQSRPRSSLKLMVASRFTLFSQKPSSANASPPGAVYRGRQAESICAVEDRIETWRGKTMCLAGPVGKAATVTVDGDNFSGIEGARR